VAFFKPEKKEHCKKNLDVQQLMENTLLNNFYSMLLLKFLEKSKQALFKSHFSIVEGIK